MTTHGGNQADEQRRLGVQHVHIVVRVVLRRLAEKLDDDDDDEG